MTFSSPAIRGDSGHDDRQPPSSKATRLPIPKHTPFSKSSPSQHGSVEKVLQGQSKNKCESVISEGVGSESVKNEGVMDVESEETLAQRQEEMEQAAMAGLSECVACLVCCVGTTVCVNVYACMLVFEVWEEGGCLCVFILYSLVWSFLRQLLHSLCV